MRSINLSNDKKRDAIVGFEAKTSKSTIRYTTPDSEEKIGIKVLKSTEQTSYEKLISQYKESDLMVQALIDSDPEVDTKYAGMMINGVKKVYVNHQGDAVFNVKMIEIIKNADGSEKERRDNCQSESNINIEFPLVWSGKLIPKAKAIKMFVFSKKYQIHHTNGLTYDFLYDMAKQLHDQQSLMLIGAGAKGTEPLILSSGGTSYRGFLEGRICQDTYILMLHLTNLELKEFSKKRAAQ